MKLKLVLICSLAGVLTVGLHVLCAAAETYPWLQTGGYDSEESLMARIPAPDGYRRVHILEGSFGAWLRGLPLKPAGAPVKLYPVSSGRTKLPGNVHCEVVNLDVLRFQQCADAIIRLRAEYLWSVGQADRICFNFTSGDACCWKNWKDGLRPVVKDGKVVWKNSGGKISTREEFLRYLDKVMEYAGSASLEKELTTVSSQQWRIGDLILQGGSPGHAVLIVDEAENPAGDRVVLLGQSFMPAQEFHILRNPAKQDSPWFTVKEAGRLKTPEWTFDFANDGKRFP